MLKTERSDWSSGGRRLSRLMRRVCLRMNVSICVCASGAAGARMRERAIIQRQAPPLQHHTLPLASHLSPLTPHPNSSIIRLLRERVRQGCFLLASASSLSSKLPLKALSAMQGCFVKLVLFCFLWLQHDHDTGVHTDDRN